MRSSELFGEECLVNLVGRHGRISECRHFIDVIKDSITTYSNSKTFQDDFTCVALKIKTEDPY